VLAMVAGSHGTEYASIIALEKLIPMLDPAQIAGTVIILPLVNTGSFEEKLPHLNPVDRLNMNRTYPGKPDGTQSERASWVITQQVIAKCDYLIDMHGGDLDESLRPYSYWLKIGNPKIDSKAREMVLAFGLRYIIIADDRPTDPGVSRYLDNTAALRGKPSITVEAGYAGTTTPEDIGVLVRGCLNEMRYLHMLAGDAPPVEHPVWFAKVITLTSGSTGIFYPLVKKNTYVSAGMELGYVTDYFGKTIYEARAPVAGVVLYICAVPSMKKDNPVVDLGVIAQENP
jgi:uncharacterized protein